MASLHAMVVMVSDANDLVVAYPHLKKSGSTDCKGNDDDKKVVPLKGQCIKSKSKI